MKDKQATLRQKYSAAFKDQDIECAPKDGVPQISRDLGIAESMLYYW